jgi:hypothetical protein
MFNDDDDEEFPASSAQDVKMESSPAPAPARYAAHKSHRDLEIYDAE